VLTHYDGPDPERIGNDPIGVRRDDFLDGVSIPAEVWVRQWDRLSLPLDRHRDALQGEWQRTAEAGRWEAMRVFSEYPMIEFPDSSLVCLDRRLLRDRLTIGIYWILANALEGHARDTITNFFGEVFEE